MWIQLMNKLIVSMSLRDWSFDLAFPSKFRKLCTPKINAKKLSKILKLKLSWKNKLHKSDK